MPAASPRTSLVQTSTEALCHQPLGEGKGNALHASNLPNRGLPVQASWRTLIQIEHAPFGMTCRRTKTGQHQPRIPSNTPAEQPMPSEMNQWSQQNIPDGLAPDCLASRTKTHSGRYCQLLGQILWVMHQMAIQSPGSSLYLHAFMNPAARPLPTASIKEPDGSIRVPHTMADGSTHPQAKSVYRKALQARILQSRLDAITQLRTHPLVGIQAKNPIVFRPLRSAVFLLPIARPVRFNDPRPQ